MLNKKTKKTETFCMRGGRHLLPVLLFCFLLLCTPPAAAAPDTKQITVPFVPMLEAQEFICEWDFPYADAWFSAPSDVFSLELAKGSLGLALSAFRNDAYALENQYETYLKGAGFQDIYAFGYDEPTSTDSLSGVIAWKKINDSIVLAAAPCGQGYGKEWGGNLEMGKEERHTGFSKAAQIMEGHIRDYIKEHNLSGSLKLWMSGFSRAAAVSNITAADFLDSGEFASVYAYLYAVPRTTRAEHTEDYPGIFNICGKFDPIAQVPLECWGYKRYGRDIFTPAHETDSQFITRYIPATEIYAELTGSYLYYNPVVNYQLHLIIEFLAEMFPDAADFADKMQDVMMNIWTEANPDTVGKILLAAFSQLQDLDSRQAYSSKVFIDYLTAVMAEHLRESSPQIEYGYWNPDEKTAKNVFREHTPAVYLAWIFSFDDPEAILGDTLVTRRLSISGDVDVEIWRNGRMNTGIDRNGRKYVSDDLSLDLYRENPEEFMANVFLLRNGSETIAAVPADASYEVLIRTYKTEAVVFNDVFCSPLKTKSEEDKLFSAILEKGEYVVNLEADNALSSFQVKEGRIAGSLMTGFVYSPTLVMAQDTSSTDHVSVPDVFAILFLTAAGTALILFVCFIIFLIHAARRRKREKPYSPWFVIVPHLLFIIGFTLLTQYATVHFFSISMARKIFAMLAMLCIFLLAVRGLIRNRCIRNVVITAGILAAGLLNVFVYQNSALVSSSLQHFIVYSLCTAVLTAAAILTFYRLRRKEEPGMMAET